MKLYQRNPDKRCWRVAAIYRTTLSRALPKSWAIARIRDIWPDGSRDIIVENWFIDLGRLQETRRAAKVMPIAIRPAMPPSTMMAA